MSVAPSLIDKIFGVALHPRSHFHFHPLYSSSCSQIPSSSLFALHSFRLAMDEIHPPSKRRRLNAAAALSRPFKSPLLKPAPIENASQPSPCNPDTSGIAKDEALSPEPLYASPDITTSSPISPQATIKTRPPNRSALATPTQSPLGDPELLHLQKQERALQSRLAVLREGLDVAKQALRIESSNRDAELERLIKKWRLASQEAADEVFAGAQERVAQMGGLAAWKERSKRDTFQWDYEGEEKEYADEYGDEKWDLGDVFEDEGDKKEEQEAPDEVKNLLSLYSNTWFERS